MEHRRNAAQYELEKRPQPQPPRSSEELEDLHKLLHFPEEVALRLTETEYQLFYQVPPQEYLRHVAQDLNTQKPPARPPPSPSRSYSNPSTANSSTQTEEESNWPAPNLSSSVQTLINRFNEVSSWATHIIVSGATIEERQAALSCLLRVAQTCWNTGNFNSAMEIVAGLKSSKLKPFWHTVSEPIPVLESLSSALLSAEYEFALARALAMPECPVVPFFGAFLRELREVIATESKRLTASFTTPSICTRLQGRVEREATPDSGTVFPHPDQEPPLGYWILADYLEYWDKGLPPYERTAPPNNGGGADLVRRPVDCGVAKHLHSRRDHLGSDRRLPLHRTPNGGVCGRDPSSGSTGASRGPNAVLQPDSRGVGIIGEETLRARGFSGNAAHLQTGEYSRGDSRWRHGERNAAVIPSARNTMDIARDDKSNEALVAKRCPQHERKGSLEPPRNRNPVPENLSFPRQIAKISIDTIVESPSECNSRNSSLKKQEKTAPVRDTNSVLEKVAEFHKVKSLTVDHSHVAS
ncbi:1-phosphatidylinositol 4,5-bisphosphate phosphodiesterase epsilon-1 [Dufourea novaeangliae]|nr:1-phosphatidylinositol 4,5-bisphosphate phosphodiesterase epsilon-1 [Dufourea novaeangliae]